MTVAYTSVYGRSDTVTTNIGGLAVQALYSIINVTTAFAGTNTADLGYLPKGAVVIGGYIATADLDTGTEVLDLDFGIADNGVDGADTDYFVNGGVYTGDNAITDFPFTNSVNVRLITGPFSVTQLSAKTKVQALCNTAANAGGTGKITVCIYYLTPGVATS